MNAADKRCGPAVAVRRAVDVLALRSPSRHLIGDLARRRGPIADGETADFGRRVEIALHHSWREELGVGDVVEVRALGIERQVVAGIHVNREQIANRPLVLRPVEPLKRSSSRRELRSSGVRLRFERVGERGKRGFVTPHPGGRHLTGPQLADHFLGDVRVQPGARDLEGRKRKVAASASIVVTTRARRSHDGLRRQLAGRRHERRLARGRHRRRRPGRLGAQRADRAACGKTGDKGRPVHGPHRHTLSHIRAENARNPRCRRVASDCPPQKNSFMPICTFLGK
jgi:hypothetical protein